MAYVENPIVEGKDFKSVVEDINGNFDSLSGLMDFTLQKPWDINDNVGSIVVNSLDFHSRFTDTGLADYTNNYNSLDIPMINDGQVYVFFQGNYSSDFFSYSWSYFNVYLSVNDTVVATFTKDDFYSMDTIGGGDGKKCQTLITVKKGDILNFTIDGVYARDGYYSYVNLNNITLEANIDTPYKYISIPVKTKVAEIPETT